MEKKTIKLNPSWISKLSVVALCTFFVAFLTPGFGSRESKVTSVKSPVKTYSRWNTLSREEFKELSRFANLDRTKRIQEHDDLDGRKALDSIRRNNR